MGVFKELVIENEDAIFRELDRLQRSFFELSGKSDPVVFDFPIDEEIFETDTFTLPLPHFQMAQVG